jgi:primosomal protein N' (replication factor Y)
MGYSTRYYFVWVRSVRYRGNEALTYRYDGEITIGSVVRVSLQKETVLGIVTGKTLRPHFVTKPIEAVLSINPLPPESVQLASWIQSFYPSTVGVITSLFLPKTLQTHNTLPDRYTEIAPPPILPPLTIEQSSALAAFKAPDTYILHGRTGSGKTRLYIELADRTLAGGRAVLILVPEIGLTSQLAASFEEQFASRVVLLHSRLTPAQRQSAWLRIANATQPLVLLGPRSALFSPLHNIGAIIIDEAHDQAYKQEQAPYYQAVRVAAQLRLLHNATLVLGSATPAITDYYLAKEKNKPILTLRKLAKPESHKRQVTIVDLKDRTQFSRTPHISRSLAQAMSAALARNQQVLLYLNRRGTARISLCQACGWQALCPRCDIPFTYHGDSHTLRCHICGCTVKAITNCPDCNNSALTFRSAGTKAIVEEAGRLFPEAHIMRFDADNLKHDRLESQYPHIVEGNVDILVGTQMLAKGLDLPRLSTLGIILADSSLYIPDYTSHEQTYQLLTQVTGRVGRGHLQGHIVIQTYQPDSPLLRAAIQDDWDTFFQSEFQERKKYFFPPFCSILKLSCKRASPLSAEKAAQAFIAHLDTLNLPVRIEGPAPAFHEKAGGKYQWQIIIKAKQRSNLLQIIKELPRSGWTYDIDPTNLL